MLGVYLCLVPLSWSTSTIYFLFDVVHLNDLLFDELVDHVVKELNVEDALKSSILVVQKAAAPKTISPGF